MASTTRKNREQQSRQSKNTPSRSKTPADRDAPAARNSNTEDADMEPDEPRYIPEEEDYDEDE